MHDMGTHVALLRGINVGGHNRVAMPDLRKVVASLGHTDVATYIQSGNVIFTVREAEDAREAQDVRDARDAREAETAAIAGALERAIAETLGVRPSVVVLTRDDLDQVIRDNPYPSQPNPKNVHAVFCAREIGPEGTAAVIAAEQRAAEKRSAEQRSAEQRTAERGSRDEATVVGRTLYLHTPGGFGRSELAALLLGRSSSPVAAGTARNWATVTKLLALCDGS
jgi:uncharacterized protein (DUF1697 family)